MSQICNQVSSRDYLDQMRELVLRVTSGVDCSIYLFGSRARGGHRRSSDVDIGFSGLDELLFCRVRDNILSELEESFIPHHVDLVNFDSVAGSFKEAAIIGAVLWKQSLHVS